MTTSHSDTNTVFLGERSAVVLAVKLDEADKSGYELALNDEHTKIIASSPGRVVGKCGWCGVEVVDGIAGDCYDGTICAVNGS